MIMLTTTLLLVALIALVTVAVDVSARHHAGHRLEVSLRRSADAE